MVPDIQPESGLPDYTVNETETVTFVCQATGIPAPSITWFRNGMELSGDRVVTSVPTQMGLTREDGEVVWSVIRTLNLSDTVDADSGTYTCSAVNSAGNDTEQFELVVQSELPMILM